MRRAAMALLAAGFAAGCASTNPRPAFEDLRDRVTERGGPSAEWARDAAAAESLAQRVRETLSEPLTAERAAQVALLNNRQMQAEYEEIGIAQADLAQASRVVNPELHATLRFAGDEPSDNTELGLSLDFLDVLIQPLRKRIGQSALEQTKLRVGDAMLRLAAEAKTAWYTHVARRQLLERLELILDINATAVEFAERQHAAGNIGELDLANQRATLYQTRVDVARERLGVREDREQLNRLMGLWGPDTAWSAPDRLPPLPDVEPPLDGLESLAIARRLDVDAARWGVNVVGRALALKKGTRFFPVGVQIGVESEKETDGVRLTGPSLALQLPLFDAGGASIARLESEHRRTQRLLEAVAIDARSEVREARDALIAARDLVEYLQTVLLPERLRIVDLTLRHYNMMFKGVYDLLLAKQAEVETERALIDAWREYWTARTELERAVGGSLPDGGADR